MNKSGAPYEVAELDQVVSLSKPGKRNLSPTSSPSPSTTVSKKKKSNVTPFLDLKSSQVERTESKLSEVPPTPGQNANILDTISEDTVPSPKSDTDLPFQLTSGNPCPGSSNAKDVVPPFWARSGFSLLKTIVKELSELKSAIVVLQGRLNILNNAHCAPRPTTSTQDAPQQNKQNECHPEEMDFDIPEVKVENNTPDPSLSFRQSPKHANYMDNCFESRTGLDPHSRVEVNISTFDGVLVAKGYNRIVTTWQGYFVEMDDKDIVKDHLTWNAYPDEGEESLLSRGLKIFSLTRPDNRRWPRAHRFAIKPPPQWTVPCNPLSTDKWYLHVYQARFLVGNTFKSLNSRTMASKLRELYPDSYHPRGKDLLLISNQQPNLSSQSGKPTQAPAPSAPTQTTSLQYHPPLYSQPQFNPTSIMPLSFHNQPFLPPCTRIPIEYTRPTAPFTQPWPTRNAWQHPPPAPVPIPQHFPAANYQVQPTTNFNPLLPPKPTVHHPVPIPTYSQVANPYYFTTAGNTSNPSPYYSKQHSISNHSNKGNHVHRPPVGQRAPGSS